MSYHSHKLNSTHSHIIGRTDPITGDAVQENDRVVFCTVCKSCFLEDSWDFMKERHCEQSQTLDTVPALPSKLTIKNRSKEMITELKNTGINIDFVVGVVFVTFLVSFFGLATSDTFFAYSLTATFIGSVFTTTISAILSSILSTSQTFKRIVKNDRNNVRIFKNRIEIGKDHFSWSDIRQIKYQREIVVYQGQEGQTISTYTPIILIYFNEGKFLQSRLPTANYERNKYFLEGLAKISHFTEVFFYSESFEELQTMDAIQSNSNGNIQVGKPRKIIDYRGKSVFTTSD
ncbi:hypothetical protein ACE193_02645 [Bernardetia sp. OM2101]|uniref:hypothetical protein n=1 Tax=Bernardetia sp. OM2101 TaxID=3344876 RepID=UPI0035CED7EC